MSEDRTEQTVKYEDFIKHAKNFTRERPEAELEVKVKMLDDLVSRNRVLSKKLEELLHQPVPEEATGEAEPARPYILVYIIDEQLGKLEASNDRLEKLVAKLETILGDIKII